MTISLTKTIPTNSSFYSGGGETTVTLAGATQLIPHSKKTLIKITRQKTPTSQSSNPSDEFDNKVLDLKNGTDEITLRGWLEDDETETAWNKFWKLRAMCSTGGALTTLVIDNLTFDSSTQEAFLEEITATINADDTGQLNTNFGNDAARIEISMNLFIGSSR